MARRAPSIGPSSGCTNASRRACRNIRFRPFLGERLVPREVAVLVVARQRKSEMREVHADLVRAPGLAARPRAAPTAGRARTRSPAVGRSSSASGAVRRRPGRAARPPVSRTCATQAAPRRISSRQRAADQHEVALVDPRLRAAAACSPTSAVRFLASSITPDVSRSSRCTSSRKRRLGPGRAHLLDHSERDPAAAVHGEPGRLVDRDQRVVFEQDRQLTAGAGSAPAARAAGAADSHRRHAHDVAQRQPRIRADPRLCSRGPRRCEGSGRYGFSGRP